MLKVIITEFSEDILNLHVILNDFIDGQDPLTKSVGHLRSLRPEV